MEIDYGLSLPRYPFDDENNPTLTSKQQKEVEDSVRRLFEIFHENMKIEPGKLELLTREHIHLLKRLLHNLPEKYECLDASQPWLCYWICHSLSLLGGHLTEKEKSDIAQYLALCQCPTGGFGGGPGQYGHLAPTYGAVCTLCIVGTQEAYDVIDRVKLKEFLKRLRLPSGSFLLHEGGEEDVRGIYCALVVAKLVQIPTDDLFSDSARWVSSCQTYEGGFAGYPGLEAHGGYTFCSIATLALLNSVHLCDLNALLRWSVNRQMSFEGGFQGRTNKLVDGCYSFWVSGILHIIHQYLEMEDDPYLKENWLFNSEALQEYVLICCQSVTGGLRDKPGKPCDTYHTCYNLSGLSITQYTPSKKSTLGEGHTNTLAHVHPLYNIEVNLLKEAMKYFYQLDAV